MSEIMEQIRQQIAESYRVCPPPCPVEARQRELAAERERQAHKAREAEEKQRAASTNWNAWFDQRFEQLWHGLYAEAVGMAMGKLRKEFKHAIGELRGEFKHAIGELCGESGAELAALEQRLKVVPGKLPAAKAWRPESVCYQAELVAHDGALYQAKRDTAQMPGGEDWTCVARAGVDGRPLNFRGRLDAYKKYRRLDVVEFDGSSFVAVHDNPSSIPGDDGWQLLCNRGTRGPAGDVGLRGRKGERGARGADAPTIVSWTLDRKNYRAVPTMSNGQAGAPLDLRGLFEQFLIETSAATSS